MVNGDSSDLAGDQSDDLSGQSDDLSTSQQLMEKSDYLGLSAPKYGTLVPNRIFVGGISSHTTEEELTQLFSPFGQVRATKIIVDRAGVSKGYGFVTFETEEEAKRLYNAINDKEIEPIIHRERRLNIAPAVKKQTSLNDGLNRHDVSFTSIESVTSPSYTGTSYYFPGQPPSGQYYQQQSYDPYYSQSGGSCTYPPPQQQSVYSAQPGSQVCYLQPPYQYQQQVQPPYLPVAGQSASVGPSQSQMYHGNRVASTVPQAYVMDQNGHSSGWTTASTSVPIPMTNLSTWMNVPMYREIETNGPGLVHHHHESDVCNCVMHTGAMQINSY